MSLPAAPHELIRMVAVAVVCGVLAAQGVGARAVTAGALVARMAEAMGWPAGLTAQVEVGLPASGAPGGGTGPPALRASLVVVAPELFAWQPQAPEQGRPAGVAWRGLIELQHGGPGPRFLYSYKGWAFLEVLRVYFGIFRPLPSGSRLVLRHETVLAGRPAVEALLVEQGGGRQASLVVDTETGLVLRAAAPDGEATLLVQAVQVWGGARPTRIEYEAPVLGRRAGRMVLELVQGRWFVTEALVDGERAQRVRFSGLRFFQSVPAEMMPDASLLQRLYELRARAVELFQARRFQEAREAYQEVVAVDPYDADSHWRLGYAAVQLGDWLTAASEFDQVIHLSPRDPRGYGSLALLYADLGVNEVAALNLAEKALKLSPERPEAWVLDAYGWALLHNGRAEEAVAALEQALVASGRDPAVQARVLYHLGVAHLHLRREAAARELFSQALELEPTFEQARQALSKLQGKGQPADTPP